MNNSSTIANRAYWYEFKVNIHNIQMKIGRVMSYRNKYYFRIPELTYIRFTFQCGVLRDICSRHLYFTWCCKMSIAGKSIWVRTSQTKWLYLETDSCKRSPYRDMGVIVVFKHSLKVWFWNCWLLVFRRS